jgi:hypothetical protein
MKKLLMIVLGIGLFTQTFGQVYSNKVVGKKNLAKADCIKTSE